MDVLPGVIAPRAKAFGEDPTTYGAGRDRRKAGVLGHATRQFGATPTRERHLALSGQATGDGANLRAHLRGKNASAPHYGARQPDNGSPPSSAPFAHGAIRRANGSSNLLVVLLRMFMGSHNDPRTHRQRLRRWGGKDGVVKLVGF